MCVLLAAYVWQCTSAIGGLWLPGAFESARLFIFASTRERAADGMFCCSTLSPLIKRTPTGGRDSATARLGSSRHPTSSRTHATMLSAAQPTNQMVSWGRRGGEEWRNVFPAALRILDVGFPLEAFALYTHSHCYACCLMAAMHACEENSCMGNKGTVPSTLNCTGGRGGERERTCDDGYSDGERTHSSTAQHHT